MTDFDLNAPPTSSLPNFPLSEEFDVDPPLVIPAPPSLPIAKRSNDGTGDTDDFGLYTNGLAPPPPPSTTRKRMRIDDDEEDTPITSPAESLSNGESDSQPITSPPNGSASPFLPPRTTAASASSSSSLLRGNLEKFRVDSQPGSRDGSVFNGGGGGVEESQSQAVVIPGTRTGVPKLAPQEDEMSSPPSLQNARRPSAFINNPQFQQPYSQNPSSSIPNNFTPSIQQQQFSPSSFPSPKPPGWTFTPPSNNAFVPPNAFANSNAFQQPPQQPQQQQTSAEEIQFMRFAQEMGGNFPVTVLRAAWVSARGDKLGAISILVGASSGATGGGGVGVGVQGGGGGGGSLQQQIQQQQQQQYHQISSGIPISRSQPQYPYGVPPQQQRAPPQSQQQPQQQRQPTIIQRPLASSRVIAPTPQQIAHSNSLAQAAFMRALHSQPQIQLAFGQMSRPEQQIYYQRWLAMQAPNAFGPGFRPPPPPGQQSHSHPQNPRQQQQQQPQPQGSLLTRTLAALPAGPVKKKKKRRNNNDSDSEDQGGDYSEGSGDEYGESAAVTARKEGLALEFFNTAKKEELGELAGCNPTQATLTIKLRPFTSANDFRSRTRKQKGIGNTMMETYLEVIAGMNEVDKVLTECELIGRELSSIMKIWTQGAGAKEGDGGLNLVAIPEAMVERCLREGDQRVKDAFVGYIRKQPELVPKEIVLKDYQMLGLNWLNLLYRRKTSCILADDMGLGKTAQVISLMAHLKETGEPGPHLVIVPSSTLENWMREFSVFAPSLHVVSYYGSQADRGEIRSELREMKDLDVVVTTYNIATSSIDDQKFLKKKMDFKICVFDEGHQLKNSESKKYKDLMQIRAQWRLLLTGTPLQNNLQELVSLLSFILPDQFRDAGDSLRAIFKVGPGTQANLLSRERISRAKKMMTPFVLRRKKIQVLKDLPSKTERIELCNMTDLQREVYNEAITRSKKALMETADEDLEELAEVAGAGLDEDSEAPKTKKKAPRASTKTGNKADQTSSSNVLMDLRKASNHPMLFRRLYDEKTLKLMARDCLKEEEFLDRNKDLIFEDMEVMTDFELHRFCLGYNHLKKYSLKNDEWMSAGKIEKLQELLPRLKANGDRVLLFSQFTQILDILEVVLDTMNIRYLKLTGQTSVTERQGLVDQYTNDPDITVFLLSTRAGGLGLNLVAANHVIFYDLDYNPHNDKQAEDRSFRIGQVRDVTIIKLITKDSLDEDIAALATTKLQLDASVSSHSQYPAGAAPADDEGNSGMVEKKMRTSLLSNLKKKFESEGGASQTQTQTQTQKS